MTRQQQEQQLLLTVARILRARVCDREQPEAKLLNRYDAEDAAALKEALAPFDPIPGEKAAEEPYSRCPHCNAPGVSRERRPDGNDRCANGHVYPSREAAR